MNEIRLYSNRDPADHRGFRRRPATGQPPMTDLTDTGIADTLDAIMSQRTERRWATLKRAG